jgi:hypothetical protein
MENKELLEQLDQHRWLLNNGLITDGVKNQLFVFGSVVHKQIQAVEMDIEVEKRLIKYRLYADADLLKKIDLFRKLSKSDGIIGLWRFKRLLKKEGSLEFKRVIDRFVGDYCGPKWSTEVAVIDFADYLEDFGEQGETRTSQQPNKLPDKK